jgi:hypothetical protein
VSEQSDGIKRVKPGDPVLAEQQNQIIERARAEPAGGLGHHDFAGYYPYVRHHSADEKVRVFNDESSEAMPAYGVGVCRWLATTSENQSLDGNDSVWVMRQNFSTAAGLYNLAFGHFLVINDGEEIPAGETGWAYPVDYDRARRALFDADQFSVPYATTPVGPIPGTWKLGPGLPGLLYANSGIDNGTRVALTTTVPAHPCAFFSGIVYDGVTNTPEINLDIKTETWVGANNRHIGRHNIPSGRFIRYTTSPGHPGFFGRTRLHDWWMDDPLDIVKLWDTTGSIPDGWVDYGTISGEKVIRRDS